MTVERVEFEGLVFYGFDEGFSAGTLLPSQSFSIGSNNYAIDAIAGSAPPGTMHFSLEWIRLELDGAKKAAALRLHVCDGDYDFSTADVSGEHHLLVGNTPRLVAPGGDPHGVPQPAGEQRRDGRAGDYRHGAGRAGADRRRRAPIMDTDGVPSSFTYKWFRVDSDGTSNEAEISGETAATYTLTAADAGKKIKVQVSFTDELSGEEERTSAAYPSSGTVTTAASTTAPALLSVTVTSTPHKDDGHLRRARAHRVLDDLRRAGHGDRRSDLRLRRRRRIDGDLLRGLGHHHVAVLPRRDAAGQAATGTRTGFPGPRTRLRSTAAPSRGQTTRWRRS